MLKNSRGLSVRRWPGDGRIAEDATERVTGRPKPETIAKAAELFIDKMRQKACLQLLVLRSFDIVCMQTISGFAVWLILFVPAMVPGNSF